VSYPEEREADGKEWQGALVQCAELFGGQSDGRPQSTQSFLITTIYAFGIDI